MSNVDEARKAEVPQTEEFINRIRSLARSKSGELWADQEVIDKLRTYKSLCSSQHEVIKGYEEQEATLVAALREITEVGGNLPDGILESRTGANDAVARGLMVTRARAIACAALEAAGVELP